ncbi:class A beta-lactamase-related serine hydrolase [Candidatus Mycobacterium methanotrophicum]|uniref:Class A beta-lactamase-related serine hydrolase n=1 Tax=Candidatus Mycobacterium methanotrophicum TaxID=2943498 RepID=A0ABY4QR20_9MYCO|nr:class A beta-lactamase-related serine hydrolase [Candidatus Mycobacterium methanotrophicum]UQX12932.1 class A beta-lactamase-related serine hydrolase [Candidatus Mycobacterium methanotrophicum]
MRGHDNGFDELSATVPARVGVAIAGVDGTPLASYGSWFSGVAWSTIKVPLAIAAFRAGVGSHELVTEAIAQSDNAAAEALWSQLGKPAEAAQKVQAVIRDADDTTTVVEARRLRSGYTAFGQTHWSLVRQAQFAARLPGVPDAADVVDLMRNLCAEHRWGLAAKGFAAKGGWGPGIGGDYLVRQFAIVPVEAGHVGVALAAQAHDGVFETGVGVADSLTDWLVDHLAELTED